MRYPIDNKVVRRFQIRLDKKDEFYQAVKLFNLANVPTVPPRPKLKQARPSSSQAVSNRNAIRSISHQSLLQSQIPIPYYNPMVDRSSSSQFASRDSRVLALQKPFQASSQLPLATPYASSRKHTSRPETGLANLLNALAPASSAPTGHRTNVPPIVGRYTPRPSTAPIGPLRDPDSGLPPPRELPFQSTINIKKSQNQETGQGLIGFTSHAECAQTTDNQDKLDLRSPIRAPEQHTTTTISVIASRKPGAYLGHPKTSSRRRQSTADDIDTQALLEKVAARRTKFIKKLDEAVTDVQETAASQAKLASLSQPRKPNARCGYCRTKKRKCEKNPVDLQGACRPCLAVRRECSFAPNSNTSTQQQELPSNKSIVQVRNSQGDVPKASELKRSSFRSDTPSTGHQSRKSSKEIGQAGLPTAALAQAEKRRLTPAMNNDMGPPTKRPKQKQHKLCMHTIKSLDVLGDLKDVTASADTRSDATTATADTNDLDPVRRPMTKNRYIDARTMLASDCPTYSEISEIAEEPAEDTPQDRKEDQAPLSKPDQTCDDVPSVIGSLTKDDALNTMADMSFDAFAKLDEATQTSTLNTLMTQALNDNIFLQVCKIVDRRWQRQVFPSKF